MSANRNRGSSNGAENVHYTSDYNSALGNHDVHTPACEEWVEFVASGGLPLLESILSQVLRNVPDQVTLQ